VPSTIDAVRAVMARYGIGNEPLWSTEGSWGVKGLTASQQAAHLAQQYILLWSSKVARYYWYAWDGTPPWGTLWNESTGINGAGIAYGQIENWLVGSVSPPSPCSQITDATWHCTLTLSNGDAAEIVWNPTTTIKEEVDSAFTTYRTLDDGVVNSIVANSVSVGNEPILVVANRKH
jgi:hypothetical protein